LNCLSIIFSDKVSLRFHIVIILIIERSVQESLWLLQHNLRLLLLRLGLLLWIIWQVLRNKLGDVWKSYLWSRSLVLFWNSLWLSLRLSLSLYLSLFLSSSTSTSFSHSTAEFSRNSFIKDSEFLIFSFTITFLQGFLKVKRSCFHLVNFSNAHQVDNKFKELKNSITSKAWSKIFGSIFVTISIVTFSIMTIFMTITSLMLLSMMFFSMMFFSTLVMSV